MTAPASPATQTCTDRRIIVTGCDSTYFVLVAELAASIRAHRPTPIGVIDCGMTPDQHATLLAQGIRVLPPLFPITHPGARYAAAPAWASTYPSCGWTGCCRNST
ncbi:hypothetical protein RAA17_06185 [Komagataeibacter rhaeticus]|nr:hypothetical protein [Komagataeibacter rhaeticus]